MPAPSIQSKQTRSPNPPRGTASIRDRFTNSTLCMENAVPDALSSFHPRQAFHQVQPWNLASLLERRPDWQRVLKNAGPEMVTLLNIPSWAEWYEKSDFQTVTIITLRKRGLRPV